MQVVISAIQKSLVQTTMTDPVAMLYSKANLIQQSGGGISWRQLGGGPFDTLRRIAMPILHGLKDKLGDMAGGMVKAIKEAGGASLQKLAADAPVMAADSLKKIVEKTTEGMLKKASAVASAEPVTAASTQPKARSRRRAAPRKRSKSPVPAKRRRVSHKRRSRIDDVLGKDSY